MTQWKPEESLEKVKTGHDPDPSGAYAALLEKTSVAWYDHGLTRKTCGLLSHEAVSKAAMDTKTFSNITVPEGSPRILPLMADPPEHGAYRRLINPHFAPARIAEMEECMRPICGEMLDSMIDAGEADFAREYAYVFSMQTLCKFLHVRDDWSIYNDWASEMERLTAAGTATPGAALPQDHYMKIIPYIQELVTDRRASPGQDVVSGIAHGEINGAPLDDQQVIGLVIALILAGRSTTASGIANFVLRLAMDQDLQQFLRENPDRIEDAREESLRIESPQQEMPRRATRDVEIAGQLIRAGDSVFLNWGSANLDPAKWEDPGRFKLDRKSPHLAFGRGVHSCFGAPLARMQMKLTVQELLARTHSFELAGPIERETWPRLSVEKMPLRFVPKDFPKDKAEVA